MKYFEGILKLYLVSNKVSYMILVAFLSTKLILAVLQSIVLASFFSPSKEKGAIAILMIKLARYLVNI